MCHTFTPEGLTQLRRDGMTWHFEPGHKKVCNLAQPGQVGFQKSVGLRAGNAYPLVAARSKANPDSIRGIPDVWIYLKCQVYLKYGVIPNISCYPIPVNFQD